MPARSSLNMQKTMRAARMHEVGKPMSIDTIPLPQIEATDVLVQVKACGMVPNLGNVLANWTKWFPHLPLPKLPAIFGLDPAGVVVEVGKQVLNVKVGQRVYVNPLRSCGACEMCSRGERNRCRYFTFNGYFGFGPDSKKVYELYPYGGFCEFMSAPQYALVRLPDNVTFEQAARFGYTGTSYGAMKKAQAVPGQSMLIDGISGTLGLGACLLGLAMGMTRIFGTGRNKSLLERVRQLAPERIEVHSLEDGSTADWVKSRTGGDGVDFMISALGPGSPAKTMLDSIQAVRRGGRAVNVGAVAEPVPVDIHWLMDEQIQLIGSNWFTADQGEEFARLAEVGLLDLSVFEHNRFPLEKINEAISGLQARNGGFSNYVIVP
jgi:D-arabinose 1-dehydrogenase-like Zn-dependent alcohol dehydrogenase